ncbi:MULTISPECIES: hypothetical protein [unclassified Eikenella]|uniref:hypothetical protein n=1 Tax=unclassified Eikenella TaxID=2639367 RepID=UPI0012E6F08B|nr:MULTISPECIES: hypothetical protein [unclassified Eikenella]
MPFLEKIEFNGQIQHILVKAAARSKITYRKKIIILHYFPPYQKVVITAVLPQLRR